MPFEKDQIAGQEASQPAIALEEVHQRIRAVAEQAPGYAKRLNGLSDSLGDVVQSRHDLTVELVDAVVETRIEPDDLDESVGRLSEAIRDYNKSGKIDREADQVSRELAGKFGIGQRHGEAQRERWRKEDPFNFALSNLLNAPNPVDTQELYRLRALTGAAIVRDGSSKAVAAARAIREIKTPPASVDEAEKEAFATAISQRILRDEDFNEGLHRLESVAGRSAAEDIGSHILKQTASGSYHTSEDRDRAISDAIGSLEKTIKQFEHFGSYHIAPLILIAFPELEPVLNEPHLRTEATRIIEAFMKSLDRRDYLPDLEREVRRAFGIQSRPSPKSPHDTSLNDIPERLKQQIESSVDKYRQQGLSDRKIKRLLVKELHPDNPDNKDDPDNVKALRYIDAIFDASNQS